jgi:hypothetical protein
MIGTMRPVRISGADDQPLGAPADWNEEKHGPIRGLFVRREHVNGINFMRSAWEADDCDVMRLYAGARLTLGVAGVAHPVVNLGTDDLPDDFEPVILARRYTEPNGDPAVRVDMLYPKDGGSRIYACAKIDDRPLGLAVCEAVEQIEIFAKAHGIV